MICARNQEIFGAEFRKCPSTVPSKPLLRTLPPVTLFTLSCFPPPRKRFPPVQIGQALFALFFSQKIFFDQKNLDKID